MCNIIYRHFSAKATAKDIAKHMSPQKQTLCVRKNHESHRESLWWSEPLRYPVFDTAHNRQSHKFIPTVNSLDNCQTKIVKKWAVMSLKIAFTQSIVGIMVQTGVSNFIAAIIAKSFLMTSSTALSTSWPAPTTRSTRTAGVGVVDILLQDEMRCPNGAKQDIVAHSAILCKISFMRWNRGMLDPPDIWAQNVWRIIYVDICWPTENTVCWNQLQL